MKKVSIVGAGLSGLSAGIYLQNNGFETEIFELSPWAGGVCSSWTRKGYRFDGCIHWMVGTKKGDGFNQLFHEVGALEEGTEIFNSDSIFIELDGVMHEVPMEIAKFRAFLHKLSENDKNQIDELCDDIATMGRIKIPIGAPQNLKELIEFMKTGRGFLALGRKYLGRTVGEIVKTMKSPTLRKLLLALMPEAFSSEALVMMLGVRMGGNAGYPLGGSLEMIKRMETKYRTLGGTIHFNSRVDKIVVEKGKATGVFSKGVFYPSDAVIAACDAHDTLKNMLGEKFRHPQLDALLENAPLFDSLIVVAYGLKKKFGIPYSVDYECPKGISVAPDVIQNGFSLRSFDFDASAAPKDGSSVIAMLVAPCDYWQKLRLKSKDDYDKRKQQLAVDLASAIDHRIPGFKEAIDVVDVATPATFVRLANLYRGSFEGFAPIPSSLKTNVHRTIPGVKNFCLCGQWLTIGGGICSAVSDGKKAADFIRKKLGRP